MFRAEWTHSADVRLPDDNAPAHDTDPDGADP